MWILFEQDFLPWIVNDFKYFKLTDRLTRSFRHFYAVGMYMRRLNHFGSEKDKSEADNLDPSRKTLQIIYIPLG